MKVVIVLLIAAMLTCCNGKSDSGSNYPNGYFDTHYYVSGMHYWKHSSVEYGVIVNITKDSLECEYYKQQLSK